MKIPLTNSDEFAYLNIIEERGENNEQNN